MGREGRSGRGGGDGAGLLSAALAGLGLLVDSWLDRHLHFLSQKNVFISTTHILWVATLLNTTTERPSVRDRLYLAFHSQNFRTQLLGERNFSCLSCMGPKCHPMSTKMDSADGLHRTTHLGENLGILEHLQRTREVDVLSLVAVIEIKVLQHLTVSWSDRCEPLDNWWEHLLCLTIASAKDIALVEHSQCFVADESASLCDGWLLGWVFCSRLPCFPVLTLNSIARTVRTVAWEVEEEEFSLGNSQLVD